MRIRGEIKEREGFYSDRYTTTQFVFFFSIVAIITTISLASPPEVRMFCTRLYSNIFLYECAIYVETLYWSQMSFNFILIVRRRMINLVEALRAKRRASLSLQYALVDMIWVVLVRFCPNQP